MTVFNRNDLDVALRNDFATFIQRCFQTVDPSGDYQHNWHIDALAYHAMECAAGTCKRLIVTMPPRQLKSICMSVALPAFLLGHDPERRIICVSYAAELAAKLARDCRTVMESAWYRRIFPQTRLSTKKSAESDFETTRQGFRYSTSVGGPLTGRGGSIIIVDDPIKPGDAVSEVKRKTANEWFGSTLYSRLDSKKHDVIVIVMQRVHVDDLAGYVLSLGEQWTHLDLPAIADAPHSVQVGPNQFHQRREGDILHPEREPLLVLEQIKQTMGTALFSAQYLQRPVPVEGNLVRWKWFGRYERPPEKEPKGKIQSWDTASKAGELNDYSVGTTWLMKGDDYYLLDVVRERLEYPMLKRRVVELARRFSASSVLVEAKGSGTQLIQDLRFERLGVRAIPIKPEQDKTTRMSNQSAVVEAGQVHLPLKAAWLDDFKAEILAVPNGKHDDQVDSVSQFLGWVRSQEMNRVRHGNF